MDKKQQLDDLSKQRSTLACRQQNKAANPRTSVWVEASAGTGKTKVLSDRVLRLFLDGISPSQILCLTYTKAAAVEMNDRISFKLAKWSVMDEQNLAAELESLTGTTCSLELINRARTMFALTLDVAGGLKNQTIHSFCQEILKRFPLEAGIPPYFEIMDDRTSREILAKVSRELILSIEKNPNSAMAQAVSFLTTKKRELKFSELMDDIIKNRAKIFTVLSQFADIESFLQKLQSCLQLSQICSEKQAIQQFSASLNRDLLQKLADVLAQSAKTDVNRALILNTVAKQDDESFSYSDYKSIFLSQNKVKAKLAYNAAINIMPNIVELMSSLAQDVVDFEDYLQRLRLYESTRAVMTVAGELTEAYATYKRCNARLDYEDLIMLTVRLLQDRSVADWILYKLDSSISHILIDEAQDTSPYQWEIIRALSDDFFAGNGQSSRPRTVFAVGDRKQSIYSFQGADPKEFDQMCRYFSQKTDNFSKIRLDVSFRSTEAVLQTVNALFAMQEAQSGVVVDNEKVNHLPYRVGQGGKVEIWPLVEAQKDDGDDIWYPPVEHSTKITSSLRLAQQIALKIKSIVENGEILESKNRPLHYGDFMVLVQRRNSFIEDFVRECKKVGVAITGVDKIKLLEQIAVEDMLSLGRFLLLPEDDLSLAEVLKSPLFGLDDDDLFTLCYNRSGSLWQSLCRNEKYAKITNILQKLLDRVDYARPFELFNYVLTALNGRKNFSARLGAEAEDAIDEFMNLALSFEREHIPDLQSFIQWICADKAEVKRELEQSGIDAVRLMTVHGSKGLQAPVVILPDTTRIANVKREAGFLWDDDGMAYFPLEAGAYDANCNRIYEKKRERAFDEYRRLLYVALTRAEDCLYICGYKQSKDISADSWYNLCLKTLQQCGVEAKNGNICFSSPQLVNVEQKKQEELAVVNHEEPLWLQQEALPETPLAKPYMPSHAEDEDDLPASSPLLDNGGYFRRGLLIHRILQLLDISANKIEVANFVKMYIAKNAPDIDKSSSLQIENEILRLFDNPQFSFIFGKNSYAEVPIAGEIDGRIVSGQIDRLYVGEDKIIIVDFKTNRPPAKNADSVAPLYRRQLSAYKNLIEKIYCNKPVETYILWTNNANLMKID